MLADYLGNDLRKVCNELTKLKLVMKSAMVTLRISRSTLGLVRSTMFSNFKRHLGGRM